MNATGIVDVPLSDRVRRVHSHFPTGVMVVTTCLGGTPYGLAVNAFSSVSLDPPVVLFCVAKTSQTHARLYAADHAAANILSHRQIGVAKRFATSGGDKFAGLDWTPGPHGSPVIDGVSAWFELELTMKIDAGTHTIFTGHVHDAEATGLAPLVYLAPGLYDGAQLIEATEERA